jgi:PadR family transcriptional regulator PadR
VDQCLISDYRVKSGKRMTRVYYHLEPRGEARLEELIREYTETTRGIFNIIGKEGMHHDGNN